jgi:hypothetical protein
VASLSPPRRPQIRASSPPTCRHSPDVTTASPLSAAVEQVIQIEKGDTLMSV